MSRVDVLAVLDELVADMGDTPGTTGHQVAQVRAAVAELMEADREYDSAFEGAAGFIEDGYEMDSYGVHGSDFYRCWSCGNESGAGILDKGVTHEPGCVRHRYEKAIQRRAAALARCRGGAA